MKASLGGRVRAWFDRRRQVVGINRRNVELVYPHNPRKFYPIADDKLRTKEVLRALAVPVPATLAVCDGLFAVPTTLQALAALDNFVVKPSQGSGGDGILVLGERVGAGRWRRVGSDALVDADMLRTHLAQTVFGAFCKQMEDRAFVEPRIEPAEPYRSLWPDGLCDVRVIVLRGRAVMAMVRVPTKRSGGRANLHQGGLGIGIDLQTGRTVTALSRGQRLTHHPESGFALLGLELPDWPTYLEIAERTARATPLGYLGVDIAVDRAQGPLVLEINARPGLEIQNVLGVGFAEMARRSGA